MNNDAIIERIKKVQVTSIPRWSAFVVISIVLGVCVIFAWYFLLNPFQEQIERRLRNYPNQLTSLQELNRTLLIYKGKELLTLKIADAEFANLKAKLLSQGLQLNVMRLLQASPAQISMQINEIEFSRWLELLEDFRKNHGLYPTDAIIKRNSNNAGIVQVTATWVQAP